MIIEWKIHKKPGNIRPLLTYWVKLEEHETALALPGVRMASSIPQPEESRQEHCYPGQYERANPPLFDGVYILESPSHKGCCTAKAFRLPWRENNEYPEVEASFALLREKLEEVLTAASQSQPMSVEGSLRTSAAARACIAPGVLAERFLRLAARAEQGATGS